MMSKIQTWLVCCITLGNNYAFTVGLTGMFMHLSDIHYDPQYSQHGDPAKACHLNINKTGAPGYYGNYACDSSWNLVRSAVEEMKKIKSKPDFILWTGDTVPHTEQRTVNDVYDIIGNVTKLMPGDVPIMPVLGNHDAFPSNQMPLAGKNTSYYEDILSRAGWSALLSEEEQQQFLLGGYYVRTYKGNSVKLRFVMLNTNLWYSLNKLTSDDPDPNKQFMWLKHQLASAKTDNYKVYIVAHICPGGFERLADITWLYPKFNKQYVELIQQYNSTILAHFCGHEHTDSFRLVFNQDGSPSSVMFLSPAVTPGNSSLPGVGANNPGIRMYHYSQTTGKVLDYYQYYMNLTQANSHPNANRSMWQLEYRATEAYSLPECNAKSFNKLMDRFTTRSSLFWRYLQYNTVSYNMAASCDQGCFMAQKCAILNIDLDKYSTCLSWSGTTAQPAPDSSTRHHRFKPHKLPRYVYYIIGLMAFIIVILAVVVGCLCIRQRRHGIPFKYGRFVGAIN